MKYIGIIVVIGLLLISGCTQNVEYSKENNQQVNDTTTNITTLDNTVIDKTTKEPVESAIVYLGGGYSGKCYTNTEGECQISDFGFGSYALGVFKKGYERFTMSGYFNKGENNLTIELEKKSEIPNSFLIEGTVIEIITAEGTRSENHYFKIMGEGGEEDYIFDDIGNNMGLEFVNKSVRINGFRETGFIGWEHREVEGIYVEEIEVI